MFLVDTHCDTLYVRALRPNQKPEVTPERLREGGVTLQVCTLFATPNGPGGVALSQEQLKALPQLTDAGLRHVREVRDAKEGESCVLLSVEGGEALGGSMDALRAFYEAGVRMIALTWNYVNDLAYPHAVEPEHPLKPFGWEVVREMNRLGMAVDVSHLGTGGFWDLMEKAQAAPMASHSCCRALHDHSRNLNDDQIRALIERGGWIGMNFYPVFLTGGKAAVNDVVRHIDHIVELGGARNVGFGSDFDGIEVTPEGLEHPGRFPALLDALRKRYDEATVANIAGGNFLAYMERIQP
ncbi:MAG TPA: dipeptidase [Clostridia bacterium]|nr:dipeptidase [Clostridia bacterium]